MRKWQNVAMSRRKRCFWQIRELCWKSLKSGAPCAKMTKGADFSLKTLFCTNSCILLKVAKKWYAQCENDKTCWSYDEKTVLYKLVHFAEIAKKRFAQCKNNKTFWSRAENVCFVQTRALCWKAKKWCPVRKQQDILGDFLHMYSHLCCAKHGRKASNFLEAQKVDGDKGRLMCGPLP